MVTVADFGVKRSGVRNSIIASLYSSGKALGFQTATILGQKGFLEASVKWYI